MRTGKLILTLLLCLGMSVSTGQFSRATAGEPENVFSTWEGLEVDKCASIWLIKRFIEPQAEIKFFPKGEPITEGVPFDTPDARFRRSHNMSTYETLLHHYRLEDPGLAFIGKIIHDIEVNVWDRKALDETIEVETAIRNIISSSNSAEETIELGDQYFNRLYKKVRY